MKRLLFISILSLVATGALAPMARATDTESIRQKIEKLKKAREAAAASAHPAASVAPKPASSAKPAASTASSAKPAASSAAPLASSSAQPKVNEASELETLQRTRAERRSAEVRGLRERWGDLVGSASAKPELSEHARRLAYLQRIRSLASQANDTKAVENVDKLLTLEERRSADALNTLRTSGGKP